MPPPTIGMHVGAAAVLVVSFVFFARGWIGGGDAKLAAATALWLGFDQLLNYLSSPRCSAACSRSLILRSG